MISRGFSGLWGVHSHHSSTWFLWSQLQSGEDLHAGLFQSLKIRFFHGICLPRLLSEKRHRAIYFSAHDIFCQRGHVCLVNTQIHFYSHSPVPLHSYPEVRIPGCFCPQIWESECVLLSMNMDQYMLSPLGSGRMQWPRVISSTEHFQLSYGSLIFFFTL